MLWIPSVSLSISLSLSLLCMHVTTKQEAPDSLNLMERWLILGVSDVVDLRSL